MAHSTSNALRSSSIVTRSMQRSLRALGARHWFKSKVSREVARRSITALARRSVIGPASAIEPRVVQQLALREAAAASAAETASEGSPTTVQSAVGVSSAPLTRAATEPTPSTRTVTAPKTDGPVDFYAEALFDFAPDPADISMLPMRRGDVIRVVRVDEEKGWWAGYVKPSRRTKQPGQKATTSPVALPDMRIGWMPRSFMRPLKT